MIEPTVIGNCKQLMCQRMLCLIRKVAFIEPPWRTLFGERKFTTGHVDLEKLAL